MLVVSVVRRSIFILTWHFFPGEISLYFSITLSDTFGTSSRASSGASSSN